MNTNVGIRLLMVQGHCTWQARRFNALGKGPWGERAPCGGEFASVMTPGAGQMLARGIAMPRRIGRCRGVSPLRASASDQPSRGVAISDGRGGETRELLLGVARTAGRWQSGPREFVAVMIVGCLGLPARKLTCAS